MRGFQIWSQNSNRAIFDPLFGQKTVEIWQIWQFCQVLVAFDVFLAKKEGQMSSNFNFDIIFGILSSRRISLAPN